MKSKILLYFPSPFPYNRPWRGVPLAHLAISRYLSKNHQVKIYARHLQKNPQGQILEQGKHAICLGITAMTGFQIYDGLKIAKAFKKKYPHTPIVWGGWHPSILPHETLKNPLVDYVLVGQSDETFPQLIKKLEKKKPPKNKIIYPEKPVNLNLAPPLPYHLINLEKCIVNTEYGNRTVPYISSYGCPFRCAFCVEQIVNKRHWTAVPAHIVVKEWLNLVRQHKADSIAVYDSNFFVDEKRVAKICQGVIKHKLNIRWGNANGRVSTLCHYSPKTWQLMKKSGCAMILTGAESGSQEALDLIEKDMNVSQISKFTRLCKKYHIKVLFSFLVGLPWSTDPIKNKKFVDQEYQATFSLIDKLLKISHENRFTYYVFLPYPGAPLFIRARKLGLKYPHSLKGWSTYLMSPEDVFKETLKQGWLTKKQARLTAMLTQYIFGLMDLDSYRMLKNRIKNPLTKFTFCLSYKIGLILAKARWKYKFFDLPLDYWFFGLVHKYSGIL
jgi:radical SAM superfamily enzyme YgiQ (UPF0313 family)